MVISPLNIPCYQEYAAKLITIYKNNSLGYTYIPEFILTHKHYLHNLNSVQLKNHLLQSQCSRLSRGGRARTRFKKSKGCRPFNRHSC